jgi:hypothetical protein
MTVKTLRGTKMESQRQTHHLLLILELMVLHLKDSSLLSADALSHHPYICR